MTKFIKRVLMMYFIIYIIPFPLNYIPFGIGDWFSNLTTSFWEWSVPLLAQHLFFVNDEVVYRVNGTGDGLFNYLMIPTTFLFSLVISFFWRLLEPKIKTEQYSEPFIRLFRYFLALTMFTYGFAKVFYMQMPELSLYSLIQSYGDSSPMGLLWRFMGHSEAYSIFTGSLEVLSGLFLLFRRTKVIGGLLGLGIMINVFLLNMTFDVPVKLFSLHIILIFVIILYPDMKNLKRFFLYNKPTIPRIEPSLQFKKLGRRTLITLKFIGLVVIIGTMISSGFERQKQYGKRAKRNKLYGVYDVTIFKRNGTTIEPSRNNFERWDRLIIEKRDSMIVSMNREKQYLQYELDTVNSKLVFKYYQDNSNSKAEFNFEVKDNYLILKGAFFSDSLEVRMIKKDREDFFLENRGFNWINEYPMNR